jgi:hypothetical protein
MTTNITRKFFTDTMGNTTANNYIGRKGEVFYDQDEIGRASGRERV